ncbi:MAG: hypothetical protein GC166_09710 [Alphaproteobacteria bacterium]|nr:hypothetical protein [Alphaproteobacteria bacterium]
MNEQAHQQLIFMQDARLSDIREYKHYQWQSTYYAIIMQASILALSRFSGNHKPWFYTVFLVLGVVAIFFAWHVINKVFERALQRSRAARNEGYLLFDAVVQATRTPKAAEGPLGEELSDIYTVFVWVMIGSTLLIEIGIALPAIQWLPG